MVVFLQQIISIFNLIVIKRPTMDTCLHIGEIIAEGSAALCLHFPIISANTMQISFKFLYIIALETFSEYNAMAL